MSLDLFNSDRPVHTGCLTSRDVARHADLYALTYQFTDNRALVAHLLHEASDLMDAARTLSKVFLEDGWDSTSPASSETPWPTGLTEAQRHGVITLASTCAFNATLFVQEAQRRRIKRAVEGWDPIASPFTD
ncbi:hypothetical protein QLQ12_06170 [Actinoplanes sp. NEAU-A12]|uniref:Uncharacterized protein n=1 Tax=Actinoplanes sandaracinus TaxID=3045177 RepID=A0ABT6WEM9_9ACTN|nr:hypothetical protein [Actinoplanes sandaracinus]MDI6098188.1 hypothetical protein [Actinoplanes sandaracinus]